MRRITTGYYHVKVVYEIKSNVFLSALIRLLLCMTFHSQMALNITKEDIKMLLIQYGRGLWKKFCRNISILMNEWYLPSWRVARDGHRMRVLVYSLCLLGWSKYWVEWPQVLGSHVGGLCGGLTRNRTRNERMFAKVSTAISAEIHKASSNEDFNDRTTSSAQKSSGVASTILMRPWLGVRRGRLSVTLVSK